MSTPAFSTVEALASAEASRTGLVYPEITRGTPHDVSSQPHAPLLPVKEDARYPYLLTMAEQNWRGENPKLVRSLEKTGTLQKSLESSV